MCRETNAATSVRSRAYAWSDRESSFYRDGTNRSGEYAQLDIGDASHFYIIHDEIAFYASPAGSCFEIGVAEIRAGMIELKPNFGVAFRLGELDLNIITIDGLFEQLGSSSQVAGSLPEDGRLRQIARPDSSGVRHLHSAI
jgi:hypothetical protein